MADFTFAELTPTAFLRRSAQVYANRDAVVDGDLRFTYAELYARCLAGTGVLAGLGVQPGDRVAVLATNGHELLEMHYAVPMRGGVLVPLNIRLSPEELGYILEHSGACLLVLSEEFADIGAQVAAAVGIPVLQAGPGSEYERLLVDAQPAEVACKDERGLLGINYTSGTTGKPKGVMTHHRGAYLQSLSLLVHNQMDQSTAYLWTVPMFHCNGWCLTWGVTAIGGLHVCLRKIDPEQIWVLLRDHGVTHFSAAPTVLTMVAGAQGAAGPPLESRVNVTTGGSPPSPTLLGRMDRLGMDVTHLYGLTETFGPIGINEWQPQWDDLDADAQAGLRARQGVGNVIAEPLRVVDAKGVDVPRDGQAVGEIVAHGNDVMLGYYRDDAATDAVTIDGWFRTGDLAVMHDDGYLEIKDRAKDIIITGGENVASVEVERVIDAHPDVIESAVVGAPDERWGEVPIAFVTVRAGAELTVEQIADHVRAHLAGFKVPKQIYFSAIPKTSTGKIQKQVLRKSLRDDE